MKGTSDLLVRLMYMRKYTNKKRNVIPKIAKAMFTSAAKRPPRKHVLIAWL